MTSLTRKLVGAILECSVSSIHLRTFYYGQGPQRRQPRDFPVAQPTQFELVMNLKNAKALRLKISQWILVLVRANKVFGRVGQRLAAFGRNATWR
jgi:hypothetical protein